MTMDLTFITNEEGQSLQKRFSELIYHTFFFDCLVGYFYSSGFYAIYESLEETKKIRILLGISTNKETYDMIQESKDTSQQKLLLSHKETKQELSQQVVSEMDGSKDSYEVEDGVRKFIEWLKSGKHEIRVHLYEKNSIDDSIITDEFVSALNLFIKRCLNLHIKTDESSIFER
ncbi:MAG: hypothetical protein JXA22_02490 [Candidatus Thermoplasmatota archaeon]|nr:hypothetical protein [Candidatus Thermoplasmatota archaeon]